MSELINTFFTRLQGVSGPVLTDLSGGRRRELTGQDLPDLLDRVAGMLRDRGVLAGDRLVVTFDNRLESAVLLLTALRHGITLCLQPTGTSAADLVRLKDRIGARAILGAAGQGQDGLPELSLEDLSNIPPATPPDVPAETPFTITFTSGSTGTPKGIVHSARSFLTCADAFNHRQGITGSDRFLNVMPMYYMAGIFNGILAPLAAGAPVVIAEAFSTPTALRFWPLLRDNGITALWLSPTMLTLVARLDRGDKVVPDSLRRLFVGTGAMAARDAEGFHATYGLAPLQSYGLSELLYISVDDAEAPNFGTVGRPLDAVEVSHSSDGALQFQSPFAFLGYLVDGELVPHRGAFQTSDLGDVSAEGILSVTGRSDDIVLRGGVNVNPVEIETALAPVLKGKVFCITGVPDDALGQRLVLVTERAALDGSALAVARDVVRGLPVKAQLDAAVAVPAIPLGPTGKIRRSALRQMLIDGAASA